MLKTVRSAHTLLELLFAIALLSILAALAVPALVGLRDRIAVRSAGSLLVSGLSRARTLAVINGGARAILDLESGTLRIRNVAGLELEAPLRIGEPLGVRLVSSQRGDSVLFKLDGRGLGQLSGASIELRRGEAVGGVIVSGFGRARQW